jgi:hypothetical protein
MNRVAGHLGFAFFLVMGLACLVFPRTIRTVALRTCARIYRFGNPLVGWMKTQHYLWMLRLLGVAFTLAAIFVGVVNLFGK